MNQNWNQIQQYGHKGRLHPISLDDNSILIGEGAFRVSSFELIVELRTNQLLLFYYFARQSSMQ